MKPFVILVSNHGEGLHEDRANVLRAVLIRQFDHLTFTLIDADAAETTVREHLDEIKAYLEDLQRQDTEREGQR